MRYGPLLFAALLCSGCRGDGISRGPTNGFVPTTPVPPLQTPPGSVPVVTISGTAAGWLWVMVMDGSGTCIDGAVIEIVSGQGKGFKGTPSASCDVWDLDGGYIIYGLVPGGSLTIRASAPGYMDSEKTFLAAGAESQQASIITLARLNGQPSIPLGDPTLDYSR